MAEAIAAIHRHGIDIVGSFVFGLDPDTTGVFGETVEFAERAKLGAAQFAVLTPFPGTQTHADLDREGRITNRDWSRYTQGHVVYQPRNMTAAQLQEGRREAYGRFYSRQSILRRTANLRGGLTKSLLRSVVNHSYRRLHRGGRISHRMFGHSPTAPAARPVQA
jgi:radical SAM superfamily enzyme YgiQ (UPF0313 family)